MALDSPPNNHGQRVIGSWHIGVGTGIAGVIPMILYATLIQGKELFPLFGLIPFAVLWGLVYVGIASIDQLHQLANNLRTALPMGIIYGFAVWWGPQVGKPLGEYISMNSTIQVVLFGVVVGLLYAYSPDP